MENNPRVVFERLFAAGACCENAVHNFMRRAVTTDRYELPIALIERFLRKLRCVSRCR